VLEKTIQNPLDTSLKDSIKIQNALAEDMTEGLRTKVASFDETYD